MRDLKECRAEVFRRSKKRIKARRKMRKNLLIKLPLCLILILYSVVTVWDMLPAFTDSKSRTDEEIPLLGMGKPVSKYPGDNGTMKDEDPTDLPENLSFALVWNTYGISSYDSATGRLVKTTDATNPQDYVTTLYLDETELFEIWELLWELDIETYPDEYDPHGGALASSPSMTLILTLRNGDQVKTVRAEEIALSYESDDLKGQKFLDTCKGIRDILTATEEWKALPEYEFFYD